MAIEKDEQCNDQKVEEFVRKCDKSARYLVSAIADDDQSDSLDTLVFMLKLVRARKGVAVTGKEEATTPVVTRRRWTPEEDGTMLQAYEDNNDIPVRDDLIAAVAARFPNRTTKGVSTHMYKLGLFNTDVKETPIPKPE